MVRRNILTDEEMRDILLEYQRTTSGLLPSEERAINSMTTNQLKASIRRMEVVINKSDQVMRDRLLEYQRNTSGLLPSEERAINNMTTEQLKASIERMEAVIKSRRTMTDSEDSEDDEPPPPPQKPKQRLTYKPHGQGDDTKKPTHHPEIVRQKAIELLLLSADSYKAGDEVNDGELIEETDNLYDTQVVVYDREDYKVVAFRGTWENIDWLANISTSVVKLSSIFKFIEDDEDIMVHKGFAKAVFPIYERLKNKIGDSVFDLTGHSQGSALAILFGYVYALDTGLPPRYFYTFGSPRLIVDDEKYPADRFDKLLDMVRFQNDNDIVTYYPHKGDTQTIAKHSTAGGILGGMVGGTAGLAFGTAVGTAFGKLAGGYKHVGTGVMLFDPLTENVIDFGGKSVILEDRNYFLLREGADFLKDPLDMNSSIAQTLKNIMATQLTMKTVENFSASTEYSKFIENVGSENVFKRINDLFNVLYRERLSADIVEKMTESRSLQGLQAFGASPRPLDIYRTYRDIGGRVWAITRNYLTNELLERYNAERKGLNRLRFNIRQQSREERGEGMTPRERIGYFGKPLQGENINAFNALFKQTTEYYLNEQLKLDTLKAQQFYKYVGLQIFSQSVLTYYLANSIIGKVQGHTTQEYGRRLAELPDIIYEGFTKTDEIILEKDKFNKISKNLYYRNNDFNDVYYLNHAQGKSEFRKLENKILGYIFYDPREENNYLNKVVVC